MSIRSDGADARAIVAPILQLAQAADEDRHRLAMPYIADNAAHDAAPIPWRPRANVIRPRGGREREKARAITWRHGLTPPKLAYIFRHTLSRHVRYDRRKK